MKEHHDAIRQAAEWIAEADALFITAGAGMGVDSGLPDFRGEDGFWRAYPALKSSGLRFQEMACPARFRLEPERAWGFYGHRLALYRRARPHPGFRLLQEIASHLPHDAFVFTSNVDGHFQRAGFDTSRLVEVHGSIHHLQCQHGCLAHIWSAGDFHPEVDEHHCRLLNSPPRCPQCGDIARPNILMFGDWQWLDDRTREQQSRFNAWFQAAGRRIVTLEIGAGTRVTTVRRMSEAIGSRLVRINPQPVSILPSQGIQVRTTALTGLTALFGELVERGFICTEPIQAEDVAYAMCETPQPETRTEIAITP